VYKYRWRINSQTNRKRVAMSTETTAVSDDEHSSVLALHQFAINVGSCVNFLSGTRLFVEDSRERENVLQIFGNLYETHQGLAVLRRRFTWGFAPYVSRIGHTVLEFRSEAERARIAEILIDFQEKRWMSFPKDIHRKFILGTPMAIPS
jgi:hypothetical protein